MERSGRHSYRDYPSDSQSSEEEISDESRKFLRESTSSKIRCSIDACPNPREFEGSVCIVHRGFQYLNVWRKPSNKKGFFSLDDFLYLYHPRYLEKWLSFRDIKHENLPLIELVKTRQEEDENRDKIWNNSDVMCYIDCIPKECLFHILIYLNMEHISKFHNIRREYSDIFLSEEFWKYRIQKTNFDNNVDHYPDYSPLISLFIDSIKFKNLVSFELLLPIVRKKNLWYYNTDLSHWIADKKNYLHDVIRLIDVAIKSKHDDVILHLLKLYISDLEVINCEPLQITDEIIIMIENRHYVDYEDEENELPLVIGSLQDEILHTCLTILINMMGYVKKENTAIQELLILIIQNLEFEGIEVWMDRLSNMRQLKINIKKSRFSKGPVVFKSIKDECYGFFCRYLLSILCQLDEFELFKEIFIKYTSNSEGSGEDFLVEISKIDHYPFRYFQFLKEFYNEKYGRIGNLLICKGRWKSER